MKALMLQHNYFHTTESTYVPRRANNIFVWQIFLYEKYDENENEI